MTQFKLVTEQERAEFAPELVRTGHKLIRNGEKLWVVKHKPSGVNEEKRDRLAYLLGKDIANVAEVKLLNNEELQNIKALTGESDNSSINNTFLIRLSGNYSLSELPCKTLEEAVAMELVYSIWIRRRDTHAKNRAYLSGIPIFFDHQTAFLGDHGLEDINYFFHGQGEGHAGSWRVKEASEVITTQIARSRRIDTHWVHNIDIFKEFLELSKRKIRSLSHENIENVVAEVGFTSEQTTQIVSFLVTNLNALDVEVEAMNQVVYKD